MTSQNKFISCAIIKLKIKDILSKMLGILHEIYYVIKFLACKLNIKRGLFSNLVMLMIIYAIIIFISIELLLPNPYPPSAL